MKVFCEFNDYEILGECRDKSGLECDAVIHLRNGRYGLIEVKLGGDCPNVDYMDFTLVR